MLPIDQGENGDLIYSDAVKPHVIRTSERSNFKKCRQLWDFTSQLRNNLESVKMNHNLAFGIDIHVGLEHYYDPYQYELEHEVRINSAVMAFLDSNEERKKAEDKATGGLGMERIEEYEQQATLGVGMLRHYAEWAYPRDQELGLKPIHVEWKFQVPVFDGTEPMVIDGRPVVYQLRVDMLAEHGDGSLWVWDHKTAGNISGDTQFLDLDTQLSSYVWAYATRFGKRVDGFMYNELEKQVPKPPKVNKNGTLSQDKRQLTNLKLYEESIAELGLDPAPYDDMLDYLRENERDYFRRTEVRRSHRELAVQGGYVVDEARDMLSNPSIYPNPGKFVCGGCDFRLPCSVRNEGGDDAFVLRDPMLYRNRTDEEDIDANTI